jgi:two-component system, chemotaxis family, response regulator Rcp1
MIQNDKDIRPIDILLVDDSPGDVRLAVEALKESRILNKIFVARDGVEAIAFLKKEGKFAGMPRPDVIFLDLNMPRKDGREVLGEIKDDPEFRRIPVVVLTISSSDEDIMKAYNLHANCYITKPVNLDQFNKVVNTIDCFWFSIVKLPPK